MEDDVAYYKILLYFLMLPTVSACVSSPTFWQTCLSDTDCVALYDQDPPNEGRFNRLFELSTDHLEICDSSPSATQMVAWRHHGPQCNPGETWRDGTCVCEVQDCQHTPFHNHYIYMCSIMIILFLFIHIGTQVYYSRLVVQTLHKNKVIKTVKKAFSLMYPKKTINTNKKQ